MAHWNRLEDLPELLGEKFMKKVRRFFLVGGSAVLLFVLCTGSAPLVVAVPALLGFHLVSSLCNLLLHEMGHLLGGMISGYRLVYLQLGLLRISANWAGKLSINVNFQRYGQCAMCPVRRDSLQYLAYNLGGVILNALVCGCSVVFLFSDNEYIVLLCLELFFGGLWKVIRNGIPYLYSGIPNDGYTARLLLRNPQAQAEYQMYLRLFAARFWEERIDLAPYHQELISRGNTVYAQEMQKLMVQ